MKCNIGEIWDYNLEFFDWKTTSLVNTEKMGKEQMNPYIEITMDSPNNIRGKIVSATLKNTFLPYWDKITDGGIVFRGTYHELLDESITVTLYNKKLVSSDIIGTKVI